MSQLFQSKALLAKLLAKENLFIEERNVDTAHFDLERRILCIPILKKTLAPHQYDLFIGHEVGHALFTPKIDWVHSIEQRKIPRSVLNVVEDARIERKIKSSYPGLRKSFIRGYNDMMEDDFFGTKGRDLTKLNFIDRANLHLKVGAAFGIVFKNEKEKNFLRQMEETETFDDVIDLADRISKYLRDEVKNFEVPKIKIVLKKQKDSIDTLDDPDKLLEELEKLVSENVEVDIEGDDSEETKPEDTQATDLGGGESDDETQTVGDLPADEQEDKIEELIESETDNSFHENEKKMFDNTSLTPTHVKIPSYNSKGVVISYKDVIKTMRNGMDDTSLVHAKKHYHEYSKSLNNVVSYMVKEFELRKNADLQKRAQISKTGELDTNRLHAYRFSEDIFKRLTTMPEGKSHGLVMFIDWSGSMRDKIQNTIRQLISLVLFCRKVNIPFEVYAFMGTFPGDPVINPFSKNERDMVLGPLRLANLFSSRMNVSDFTTMASIFSSSAITSMCKYKMPLLGTPLNETIVAAMSIVPEFKDRNKLQIVNTVFLTDGESDTTSSFYDPRGMNGRYSVTGEMYITDPKTRFSEKTAAKHNHRAKGIELTMCLIRLLKYRTNSHVLGFFVVSQREFSDTRPYFANEISMLRAKEVFAKEKSVIVENVGYDQFYIIKNEFQEVQEFGDIDVASSATRSVLSAFKKHSKNKLQSRTMLNRFIQMIA